MDGGQQQPMQPVPEGRCHRFPLLPTVIGFVFLTFNSAMAAYKFSDDMGAISFVVFSYLDIVLLFYSQTEVADDPPNAFLRRNLRVSVWMLTTLLTIMFCYKIALFMPLPMAAIVWCMAAASLLGASTLHMAVGRAPRRQIPL
nr:unnamed protein product [Digitaria exilis]